MGHCVIQSCGLWNLRSGQRERGAAAARYRQHKAAPLYSVAFPLILPLGRCSSCARYRAPLLTAAPCTRLLFTKPQEREKFPKTKWWRFIWESSFYLHACYSCKLLQQSDQLLQSHWHWQCAARQGAVNVSLWGRTDVEPLLHSPGDNAITKQRPTPDLMTSQPATSWPSTSHLQQSVCLFVNMEQDYQ